MLRLLFNVSLTNMPRSNTYCCGDNNGYGQEYLGESTCFHKLTSVKTTIVVLNVDTDN